MNPARVNNMTFTRKASRAKVDLVLQACKLGRTRQELEIILGLSKRTVLSYVLHLQDTKQLHIASWKREGIGQFYPVAVYKTGPGLDAPKPGPLTETEKQKRAWAKLKADPVRYAKHRAKKARKPVQAKAPADSPFNWRGRSSQITNSTDWRKSIASTAATAGSGTDPRKQFTITRSAA